jgi:hypothetical protein
LRRQRWAPSRGQRWARRSALKELRRADGYELHVGGAQMELDEPERHRVLPTQVPEEDGRSG